MLRKFLYFSSFGLLMSCTQNPVYKDKSAPVDRRVEDLLNRMTPEEKFFQLFMVPFDNDTISKSTFKNGMFGFQVSTSSLSGEGGNGILDYAAQEDRIALAKKINRIQKHFIEDTRLGIPAIFFDESLHGLVRKGATSFPQAIALASTFDTALVADVARAIATETKARGIRQVLSPVVNIAIDVRWGRTEETYGEDPFLVSSMAVSFIREFERMGIITTPKHFVANVGDGGRDSYPIDINERQLEEYHFPAFKSCIDAGSRSIMTSYNSLNGEPNSQNDWLLRKKLKEEWGFEGFVISDANAVGGANVLHKTSSDYGTSGKKAIESGLDVIFQTSYHHYGLFIPPFLDGTVDQRSIDEAVARVLKAKFELGLFDNPYVDEKQAFFGDSHKELALKAAHESVVLLKNNKHTLPLLANAKTLALIGRDAMEARLGGYSGPGNRKVSILRALDSLVDKINYAEGCGRTNEDVQVIAEEYLFNSRASKGLYGEYFSNIDLEGKPAVTRSDAKIDFGWTLYSPDPKLANGFYSVRWTGKLRSPRTGIINVGLEGNDGYRLFIDDSLIVNQWIKQSFHRKLAPYPFEKDQQYTIRIEFFEPVGNARIRFLWDLLPDDSEQEIREAVDAARQSEVAVVVAGIVEGEFRDRAKLGLPGRQVEMIRRVAATGVPTIVVLIGGSAITMTDWIDEVDAILLAWYPGEMGGEAIANTLLGRNNPGGKLPITFPLHEGQLPLVYNHKPSGRGDDYVDLSGRALFPFGFGLSYTTFDYSSIKIDKKKARIDEDINIEFDLMNTGSMAGDEVVQLYIKDQVASVVRPVMELKGFQRMYLMPGEKKTVQFRITPSMFSMLNMELERVVEPGKFTIMIGSSSNDIRLVEEVELAN